LLQQSICQLISCFTLTQILVLSYSIIWRDFWWYKIYKLLKVAYLFSRRFSSGTHREKTSECKKAIKPTLNREKMSEWKKAIKCRLNCFVTFWRFLPMSVRRSFTRTFSPDECRTKSFEKMNTLLSAIFAFNNRWKESKSNNYKYCFFRIANFAPIFQFPILQFLLLYWKHVGDGRVGKVMAFWFSCMNPQMFVQQALIFAKALTKFHCTGTLRDTGRLKSSKDLGAKFFPRECPEIF